MAIFAAILGIVVASVLTSNIVFSQSVGICPLLGVSKKMDSAVGMGLAVTFVNTLASVVCFLLYKLLIVWDLEYLDILTFILVIAALVQALDIVLKKFSPTLYSALGVYLPLITTNCAIFLTVNMMVSEGYVAMGTGLGLLYTAFYAFAVGIGFLLALVLMAGVRGRDEIALIPKPFRGFPIALIAAGLIALAFSGFLGI
ncbi:MAG: electron transport complex subunit RsxA [Firmicutes bacterium]|nr:electron transport complex subunit RsxA [Bacillota bacterium]